MISTIRDVMAMLFAKPGRMVSQGIGMALGAGLFVVALGFGQTLSAQVDDRFDAIKATTVSVDFANTSDARVKTLDDFITAERRDSALGIAGIVRISRLGIIREQQLSATPTLTLDPYVQTRANVIVADPVLLETVEATIRGFTMNAIDATTRRDVAVLGRGLATTLGIERPGMLIHFGGCYLQVIGIIEDTKRLPDLLGSLIISEPVARIAQPDQSFEARAIIQTAPGAGQAVATNLALQLRPDDPNLLKVIAPPNPEELHRSVSGDVRMLSLAAAIVVLVAGVFAATNLMLLSITSRIPELGMRRAMGASTVQILGLVLTESITVGLVAGVVGTMIGLWVLLGICIANQWSPVIGLDVIWIGMFAGVAGGALGGMTPAIVAARVLPANALRR